VVLGLQTFVNIRLVGLFAVAPFVQLLFGAGLAVSGWMLSRGRGWAAISSAALGALTVLSTIVFSVTALFGGYVTLMPVFVIISGVAGAIMAGVSIGECLRGDKARERLAAQGLDMGL
jgi:putative effector of murein hydrolase